MSSGAFDLLDLPLVYVLVKWKGVKADDDGNAVTVEHVVELQVEILDRDEFASWIIEANKSVARRFDDFGDPDPADTRTDEQITAERAAHELAQFKRIVKGWRKMKAGTKTAEFNDANIAKLLKWPGFVTALGIAYMDAWRGEVATREGNSEGSLVSGQAVEPTAETPKATTSAS